MGQQRAFIRLFHKTRRSSWRSNMPERRPIAILIASDLSWRTLDVVQGRSLRWLVECFYS